MKKSTV